MTGKEIKDELLQDEGIIVDAPLEILRQAAKKVLFDFHEKIFNIDGEPRASESEIQSGDTVLFVENMPNLPARVVAVKIIRDFWYVNAMSETPKGGYPSGRDAMKAAELDQHNLEIFERFVIEKAGRDHVRDIENWHPDLKSEAADVLGILKLARRKWHH